MTKIIGWLLILSPYIIPAAPFLLIDSSWTYWTGFTVGAVWMFITLTVGDIFKRARSQRGPTV